MFTYIIYLKELYRILVRGSRSWSRNYIRKMFKRIRMKRVSQVPEFIYG